ncbi:MAG TPA: pyridoxal-dependent decarboxylase [Nocardioides sp.]|uniref:pyridoxal phosphate-dependent decarboxylase family protein n=1 Tax=Nocardioides sp. TaxID=35761 RepID=UPI002E35C1A0|nr:pyridoxal-dependent decarboxylase [Nocardioides sp.]HEX5088555.1 pyridoxal-dependent decarboxylase [Nocardioides sp.]
MNDERAAALPVAVDHARSWLESLADRPVPPQAPVEEVVERLGSELPDGPQDPAKVVEQLATACEPGLTAMPSGRFYGMVIGGTHPAALAADWLVSAWDQNAGLARVTPAMTAVEQVAGTWLLDILGLPAGSAVGFVTGGTMANFTGLAAGRDTVLRQAGWDVSSRGLVGGPGVRVLVGLERHDTVDLVLRYLGLGAPTAVEADAEGRLVVADLERRLLEHNGPTVVCLQAGNVHSGGYDPFTDAIEVAHDHGAWVHVDGAFGLFAAATTAYRHLLAGVEGADSWATDAHKTLNVPYDCGISVVRDPAAVKAAMGMHGDYLIHDEAGDPFEKVPELSRRARSVPVYAVLAALGRTGVSDLVERMAGHAAAFARGIEEIPGAEVLNDVVFTQVCVSFGDDERTRAVVARLLADGEAWMSGSVWRGRAVLRISVSNWSTTESDVRRSLRAVARAAQPE